ncbi:MAG TPA: tetratricopeptide repeat protein [Vicinamibacterales bacterium]|nr:tetratricopeptide repeat protein [Vicinamibacterales bacterium]
MKRFFTQSTQRPQRTFFSACSARFACGFVIALASACAPKVVPLPTVTAPKFPEFVQPSIPPAYADSPVGSAQTRGWTFLQAGDLKSAEREFTTALKVAPAFYPAEAGLGYVAVANKDPRGALPHFDRALEGDPRDVSALVGRGQALLALNRTDEALTAFRAALAVQPGLTDIRQRVEVLTFRSLEQDLAKARVAAKAGRADEAIQAYTTAIASSPESPFLYRELAAVERQKGSNDAALDHYRKAASLDPSDAHTFEQIGELLEAQNDFDGAAKAYSQSLALEANADVERRLEDLQAKSALARLPAEYRAIDQAAQITRADLAALIGIRLAPLLSGPRSRDAALITDVRNNWASTWIVAVARAGIMEPFANHQFQPRSVVHRTDLAQASARLLAKIAAQHPNQHPSWENARLKFSDLSAGHLAYPAASVAVAAGVMKTGPGDSFQPSRAVSGADAIDAIAKLESLAGLPTNKR